jgi:hypothetical protein
VRELRVRNVELKKRHQQVRDIDRMRVVRYMRDLGVDLVFVDLMEQDTKDGKRQCKTCLHTKPLDRYKVKGKSGGYKPSSKNCDTCRDHRGGTNIEDGGAE